MAIVFEFFKRLLRGADGEPRFPVPNSTARGVTPPESEPETSSFEDFMINGLRFR